MVTKQWLPTNDYQPFQVFSLVTTYVPNIVHYTYRLQTKNNNRKISYPLPWKQKKKWYIGKHMGCM